MVNSDIFSWTYSGVDFSLDGNGGPNCYHYLSRTQMFWETLGCCTWALFQTWLGIRLIKRNRAIPPALKYDPCSNGRSEVTRTNGVNGKSRKLAANGHSRAGKKKRDYFFQSSLVSRVMASAFLLTFAVEIGYKVYSGQLIWLLNPCHIMSITQICLLLWPEGRYSTIAFRLMLYLFHGAALAIVFPVVNTLLMPFEPTIYYVQHILLLILPLYMAAANKSHYAEPISHVGYLLLAMALESFFNLLILQPLALMTHVNLNNILCPAISDPFAGQWYRVCAFIYCTAHVTVHGKLYGFACRQIYNWRWRVGTSIENQKINENNVPLPPSYCVADGLHSRPNRE